MPKPAEHSTDPDPEQLDLFDTPGRAAAHAAAKPPAPSHAQNLALAASNLYVRTHDGQLHRYDDHGHLLPPADGDAQAVADLEDRRWIRWIRTSWRDPATGWGQAGKRIKLTAAGERQLTEYLTRYDLATPAGPLDRDTGPLPCPHTAPAPAPASEEQS